MGKGKEMYASFTPLADLKQSAFRIFDPFAYRLVDEIRFVPVGLGEASNLARLFPIVWIPNMVGALQPVVLLRLQANPAQSDQFSSIGLRALPNLLQAYPFRVRNLDAGDYDIGIERILPARERDNGSYVYDSTGELLPGAKLKLAALEGFLEGQAVLRDVTLRLQQFDVMEAVCLPDTLQISQPLPPMFAALESFDIGKVLDGFEDADLQQVIVFLVAQRMSLYRMRRLIDGLRVENA
jgi:hypothetical protein